METAQKKPVAKMLMYGAATCALYGVVFAKETMISDYFARGGMFTVLPIATVFLFSWIHGTFAGALWSVMGIDAKKSATKRPTVQAPVRKPARPRPTLHV